MTEMTSVSWNRTSKYELPTDLAGSLQLSTWRELAQLNSVVATGRASMND